MVKHINLTCKSSFYHLRNIARIRKYLSLQSAETLVHAFISSKLDNYNSLLYGLPKLLIDRLQAVQNASARLIMLSKKRDHITPILRQLHWLPISSRINFKIILLAFKCLHGTAPLYLQELISKKTSSHTLRSSSHLQLAHKPYNLKKFGFRSFYVAAPFLWNSVPPDIRDITTINLFKSKLKTHLFTLAYDL